jgi:hypothetical protein
VGFTGPRRVKEIAASGHVRQVFGGGGRDLELYMRLETFRYQLDRGLTATLPPNLDRNFDPLDFSKSKKTKFEMPT